ncbi:hypothetical protein [Natronospora cellulosivora (SeqCode)]
MSYFLTGLIIFLATCLVKYVIIPHLKSILVPTRLEKWNDFYDVILYFFMFLTVINIISYFNLWVG